MRKKQQRWRMEREGEERRREEDEEEEEKGTRFASSSGDSGTHYGGR